MSARAYFQGRSVSFKEFIICDACLLKLIVHAHHIWGFPTMVVPNNHDFPTKNDHFEVFWGYHHFRKHPHIVASFAPFFENRMFFFCQEGETFPIIVTDDVMQDNQLVPGSRKRLKLVASCCLEEVEAKQTHTYIYI